MDLRDLAAKLEKLASLDRVSDALARLVSPAVAPVKSLLSGTWLGHPLHPALSDVPLGLWSGAVALDLFGGEASAPAVDRLVGLGSLAALPTALSGISDWADAYGPERRVGLVHAAMNSAALGLFMASLAARRRARALRILGIASASAGAYLGGHMSYAQGLGVDHQAFLEKPEDWVDVLEAASLEQSTPTAVQAGGARVMLYRRGDEIYAISAVCPHAGGPLHEGTVDGGLCVTCPWHGSRFRLEDGRAVRGPASAPATLYEARVRAGRVEVKVAA
ncbi:MAG TPA: Rieske (2Fe-2S) protein [Candidatus Binatia bacterium]|nr:Rieske (2Fe-2S) protein [Candidatus Binatia bacterium]